MAPVAVASLWIGDRLSWLEQLCLKSFVDAGHPTTLFTYGPVEGVPDGVEVAPAADILPQSRILRHERTGSPAFHADVFRLQLIRQTDFCWVDTDAYCVKPFVIPRHGHWHGLIPQDGKEIVNNGVLKLPKGSKTLKALLDFTADEYPIPPWFREDTREDLARRKAAGDGLHVSQLPWGVWGPQAITHFLKATGEIRHTQPEEILYPIGFRDTQRFFRPQMRERIESAITDRTCSVHFWGRRFRSIASRTGGVPIQGSFIKTLLERHEIDPRPTSAMMMPSVRDRPGPRLNPKTLDFSMFSDGDVAQLMLQRSSTVSNRNAIKAWTDGDPEPLLAEVCARRQEILHRAFDEVQDAFRVFLEPIASVDPARLADIGAGSAFIDLLLFRRLHCGLVLIDIEATQSRHFGWEEEGAGYSSLATARAFLEANHVPSDQIVTVNPASDPQALEESGPVDVAISLLSCGFHYPARTYDSYFRTQVAPGGGILLDIRRGSGGLNYLRGFGTPHVLARGKKVITAFVRKAGDLPGKDGTSEA